MTVLLSSIWDSGTADIISISLDSACSFRSVHSPSSQAPTIASVRDWQEQQQRSSDPASELPQDYNQRSENNSYRDTNNLFDGRGYQIQQQQVWDSKPYYVCIEIKRLKEQGVPGFPILNLLPLIYLHRRKECRIYMGEKVLSVIKSFSSHIL